MSEHMMPIPSRLYNVAVGGHVAGADQIIDDETGLTLDKIAGGALEEKEYTSGSNNGMGRVVLRKNLVEGVNTLTQNMINKSNTVYIIQYDFTLGEDITVPANCILEFDGGSISGDGTNKDTITLNGAEIRAIGIIFKDVKIAQESNLYLCVSWFSISSNNDSDLLENLIDSTRRYSTLIIDRDIHITKALNYSRIDGKTYDGTEKRSILYSEIKGLCIGNKKPNIFIDYIVDDIEVSPITLGAEGLVLSNIEFNATVGSIYSSQDLSLVRLLAKGAEGDNTVENCDFISKTSKSDIILEGRGNTIRNCGLYGNIHDGDGAITIVARRDTRATEPPFDADTADRAIRIYNNRFHSIAGYAVKFEKDDVEEDSAIVNCQILDNYYDAWGPFIYSNCRHKGLQIINNGMITKYDSNSFLMTFTGTVENAVISNNVITTFSSTRQSDIVFNNIVKGLVFTGNIIEGISQRCITFYYDLSGQVGESSEINISNNIFKTGALKSISYSGQGISLICLINKAFISNSSITFNKIVRPDDAAGNAYAIFYFLNYPGHSVTSRNVVILFNTGILPSIFRHTSSYGTLNFVDCVFEADIINTTKVNEVRYYNGTLQYWDGDSWENVSQ